MIVGGRVGEGLPTSPGDMRAYDVRTGALRWSFHTIPHPGEPGYETWPKQRLGIQRRRQQLGRAWRVDERRASSTCRRGRRRPTSTAPIALGDNLFANSLIALDAATGKRVWHFQFVRHDIWDRDLPSPPSLVTRPPQRPRRSTPSRRRPSTGYLFLFDRANGDAASFRSSTGSSRRSTVPGEETNRDAADSDRSRRRSRASC